LKHNLRTDVKQVKQETGARSKTFSPDSIKHQMARLSGKMGDLKSTLFLPSNSKDVLKKRDTKKKRSNLSKASSTSAIAEVDEFELITSNSTANLASYEELEYPHDSPV